MSYKECDFQVAVTRFIHKYFPSLILFSVPNEAASKRWKHFQSMGALPGAPDLVLVTPDQTIFLECKSDRGHLSDHQRLLQIKCNTLNQPYYVIRDLEDLKSILRESLPVSLWNNAL